MWAVYKNHHACAQLLIQHKAHVNLIDEEDSLTPLIVAAGRGYSAVVELLISSGVEVIFSKFFSFVFKFLSRIVDEIKKTKLPIP